MVRVRVNPGCGGVEEFTSVLIIIIIRIMSKWQEVRYLPAVLTHYMRVGVCQAAGLYVVVWCWCGGLTVPPRSLTTRQHDRAHRPQQTNKERAG